ncbi:MAG: hypoxanthine phosphoribosyltransferase [Ruminococcaceae bacterium]|nr:hypoxanthine phosphoribosyltransferase [Oscillospiraceae bacterium]
MTHIEKDVEEVLLSEKELSDILDRIAADIVRDYKDSPRKLLILSILKGSLIFTSDLMRRIPLPLELDFMKVSSYGSGTVSSGGPLKISLDLKRDDIADLDILIVEDIIDSGNTLSKLKKHLAERGAHSVKICTLLDKPSRREVELSADYCGAEIPDKFVIGYGLDYDEKYRNLPYVGVLSPKVYS